MLAQPARRVCEYLSVKIAVILAIAPLSTVRSSSLGSGPDWQSLKLHMLVVAEACPGASSPHLKDLKH